MECGFRFGVAESAFPCQKMSFRRYGRGALWLSRQIFLRIRSMGAAQRFIPRIVRYSPEAFSLARNVLSRSSSSNGIVHTLRFLLRGLNARAFIRPFAVVDHNRIRYESSRRYRRRFKALLIRRPPKRAIERIKELFLVNIRYNPSLVEVQLPERLDAYDIGSNIACGCHAAVYELRLRSVSECCDTEATTSSAGRRFSESTTNPLVVYPLALKIMFNYQFDAPERYLWADMGPELIPLVNANQLLKGHLPALQTLRRSHPNVVKMYTAFTDRMPILADARSLYPEALPNANFYELIVDEPKTLFIVMKRYRMTLREYVLTVKRNYWSARVMLGQLLEAIVFLFEHTISHRDMKSDNILLDFDSPEEAPHLVLSDFGCALATGSWLVPYPDDTIDLGGNLALRAPEIRCARPGPGQMVDFRMADLWACATLGYEMCTRSNPFYSRMKSSDYVECELPELPTRVHYAIKALIKDMLWRDPSKRPDPHVAANVLNISLFRFGDDIRSFLMQCGIDETILGCKWSSLKNTISSTLHMLSWNANEKLDEIAMLYAAETILAKRLEREIISTAELQLRATFLARLDREQVSSALNYFFMDPSSQSFA